MKVQMIEPTPNPNAYKFVLDTLVLEEGARHYNSASEATGDALGTALFGVSGVTAVYCTRNFVTLTLADDVTLDAVGPRVDEVFQAHSSPAPAGAASGLSAEGAAADDNGLMGRINAVLEQKVMPVLAMDGGGMQILGLEQKKLRIRYQGACGGCPSAAAGTLMAIQNLLKAEVDAEIEVVPG